MKIVSTLLVVFALWLLGTLMVPSVRADEYDKKTVITFSQPFEIPGGKVLPGGHISGRDVSHAASAPVIPFKRALRDTSTAVWRGMIRVEKDAQKTNSYQENRNLMLSPTTHAVPIPGLEILANDVRCTHGATVSRVDREELFYAMARGLSRGDAERLIVRGFFQDVLDRIELEPVREALGAALEARIPQ